MEYYSGGMQDILYLYHDEYDRELLYNILAYYRMSPRYDDMLATGHNTAVLCEKLFNAIRQSLGKSK